MAEDSPLNQQVALKQLEKLGYAADAVADGSQALEAHARTPYDIILMDCQMPVLSGYEATWQIRNREQEKAGEAETGKRVYIIAMTANTQADNREKCAAAGMDGFINKPVQLAELEVALLHALADQAATKEMDEVIDPVIIAGLHQLRTPGKPDPLVELIDLFLREAPTQLDTMSDAVAKNDMCVPLPHHQRRDRAQGQRRQPRRPQPGRAVRRNRADRQDVDAGRRAAADRAGAAGIRPRAGRAGTNQGRLARSSHSPCSLSSEQSGVSEFGTATLAWRPAIFLPAVSRGVHFVLPPNSKTV